MTDKTLSIRLCLSKSSSQFLDAFFDLMHAIANADQVMLEDEIAESYRAVVATLRGLKFEPGKDDA